MKSPPSPPLLLPVVIAHVGPVLPLVDTLMGDYGNRRLKHQ